MEQLRKDMWGRILTSARTVISRWSDRVTCGERDDLVQETALAVWQSIARHQSPRCLPALIATIGRRMRGRAVGAARRGVVVVGEGDAEQWPAAAGDQPTSLRVDGVLVPADWLLERLQVGLARLPATNRRLVLEFYAGANCRDLAARHGISEKLVKVRLYRSRAILRKGLEVATRAAGWFEA